MLFLAQTKTNKPEDAILRMIVFLDLFDFPLTAYEIFIKLDRLFSLFSVSQALTNLVAAGRLEEGQGFYFLPGRSALLLIRNRRYNYSCAKLKIAHRFSFFFSLFPGVKAVAVVNFIGSHNLRQGSDIDFFIITATRRIWLSRLFCAGFTKFLGHRPTKQRKQDKICLSFYVTEDELDLSGLALSGESDPYFYHWLRGVKPLAGKRQVWQKFWQANRINNFSGDSLLGEEIGGGQANGGRWGDFWEKVAKMLQLKIMAPPLKAAMNKSDGVIISDGILKLYLVDRRREFTHKFQQKINEIAAPLN